MSVLSLPSAPANAHNGDMYYNTVEQEYYNFVDGEWVKQVNEDNATTIVQEVVVDEGYLKNTAKHTDSLTIFGNPTSSQYATNIGYHSNATGTAALSLGYYASVSGNLGIALNGSASAGAIMLGNGTNNEQDTFKVALQHTATRATDEASGLYTLLNSDGTIPTGRYKTMVGADGTNPGTTGSVPAPTATDNTKFLRGDGTWQTVPGGSSETYSSGVGITVSPTGVDGYIGQNSTYSDGILTTTGTSKAGLLLPDTINNLNNNTITTFTFVVKVHVLPYSSYSSGCHLISLFNGSIFIANGQASLGSYGSANPRWTTEQDVYLKVEKTSSLITLSWASDPAGTWTSILSNSYYLTSDLTGNWELGAVVDSFTTNAGISFDLANSYLEIDSTEVWRGYDATSTNKTISVNSNYLKNNAKYAKSVVIGEATNSTYGYSVAVGYGSYVGGYASSAFGSYARVYGQGSVQLGEGTNNTENCLQFKNTPIIVNGALAPDLVTQVKNAATIVVEDYTV